MRVGRAAKPKAASPWPGTSVSGTAGYASSRRAAVGQEGSHGRWTACPAQWEVEAAVQPDSDRIGSLKSC